MKPTSRDRLLPALLLSLGLHAAVAAWFAFREEPVAPAVPKPVEVALQFVEVDVPPPAPAAPPPPPPPAPVRAKPPRRASPTPPAPPPEAPPPPAPVADAAPPPTEDLPRADAPRAEGPGTGTARLLPSSSLTWSLGPGGSGADAGVSIPEPTTPEEKISDMVLEGVRRGKVDRGLVHPYFSALGKSLLKNWDAERAVSAKGLSGFLEQSRGNSAEWMRVWTDRAATYARTGSPLDADTPEANDRGPPGGDPLLEAKRALRRQMKDQFRASRHATVRVVQDAEGRLLDVQLVSPSNDGQLDREALVDIRAAAEKLPVPPPEALQGRTRLVSLWRMELIVSISPPVPMMSLEFDAEMKITDVRRPLDRRLYKRVRLLEVR